MFFGHRFAILAMFYITTGNNKKKIGLELKGIQGKLHPLALGTLVQKLGKKIFDAIKGYKGLKINTTLTDYKKNIFNKKLSKK